MDIKNAAKGTTNRVHRRPGLLGDVIGCCCGGDVVDVGATSACSLTISLGLSAGVGGGGGGKAGVVSC